jgi:hypothetical protein
VYEWAEPILGQIDTYYRRNKNWKVGIAVLVIAAAIVQYLYSQNIFLSILVALMAGGFLFAVRDFLLHYPDLPSKPKIYCLHLVRLRRRASDVKEHRIPLHEFEETGAALIGRINRDLEQLEDNLAASRTFSMLESLRSYVLKFATLVADEKTGLGDPRASDMLQTMGIAAETFYRFSEIGDTLLDTLQPSLSNAQDIPERDWLISSRRAWMEPIRSFYSMPPLVHYVASLAIALAILWATPIDMQTKITSSFLVAVALLGIFAAPLREWLKRSKLAE